MAKKAKADEKKARSIVRQNGYLWGVEADGHYARYWVDAPKKEAKAKAWAGTE